VVYELRQYRVKKGKMKQWLKLMDEEVAPFQASQGMVIVARFTAPKEKDLYVWLRRFRNEVERKRQYRKVYESDHWKTVLAPRIDAVLDIASIAVTDLEPTPSSILM
jgi:NIPSNAP